MGENAAACQLCDLGSSYRLGHTVGNPEELAELGQLEEEPGLGLQAGQLQGLPVAAKDVQPDEQRDQAWPVYEGDALHVDDHLPTALVGYVPEGLDGLFGQAGGQRLVQFY
jgi:hypothetical protein